MSSTHSSQAQYFAWRMFCVQRVASVCACVRGGWVGLHQRNALKRVRRKKGGGKGSHARQSQSDSRRLTFVMEAIGGSQHLGCWAMLQKSQQSRVPPVSHTTQASLCSSSHSGRRCLPLSTLAAALAPPPSRAHRSRSSSIWEREGRMRRHQLSKAFSPAKFDLCTIISHAWSRFEVFRSLLQCRSAGSASFTCSIGGYSPSASEHRE